MKKLIFLAIVILGCSYGVNATAISPVSDPMQQVYSTISSKDLSKMSTREFESYLGRRLSSEEKVQFKQEKKNARMKMKKHLFNRDGGFPWWSLVLGVLAITFTLIAVL